MCAYAYGGYLSFYGAGMWHKVGLMWGHLARSKPTDGVGRTIHPAFTLWRSRRVGNLIPWSQGALPSRQRLPPCLKRSRAELSAWGAFKGNAEKTKYFVMAMHGSIPTIKWLHWKILYSLKKVFWSWAGIYTCLPSGRIWHKVFLKVWIRGGGGRT